MLDKKKKEFEQEVLWKWVGRERGLKMMGMWGTNLS
jgi:hypothetical protein